MDAPSREIVYEGGGSVGCRLIFEGGVNVMAGNQSPQNLTSGYDFAEGSLLDRKPRSAVVAVSGTGLTAYSVTRRAFCRSLEKYLSMPGVIIAELCGRRHGAEGRGRVVSVTSRQASCPRVRAYPRP